jgi:hypothetical protein
LPYISEGGVLSSINERFRILKYVKGNKFKDHCDGLFPRTLDDKWERSVFTLHLYLNEGSDGGETIFYHPTHFGKEKQFKCVPKKGRIAVFRQYQFEHCGAQVKSGTKYTVRTDIMYRNYEDEMLKEECEQCGFKYKIHKCIGGHNLPYCKCPNAVDNQFYCVTCDKGVKDIKYKL